LVDGVCFGATPGVGFDLPFDKDVPVVDLCLDDAAGFFFVVDLVVPDDTRVEWRGR